MSLFPDIKIDGHAFKEGLDANGGPLQKVIQKNQFTEALRGQPFRRKLASILARIRTPVRMAAAAKSARPRDLLPVERRGQGRGP